MSTPAFTQVDPAPWPSGYGNVIATVDVPIEELAERHGLALFSGSDNLDAYRAAAVRLRSGRRLGLVRHDGDPAPGTELHADAGDDVLDALREFLDAFDLSADDLLWVRDDVPQDHLRPAEKTAEA
ncbi:MAG TPA: hypothetical protein VLK66_14840 [Longimicrobium sp.]|nr:hypothetical protein [Longimicrobium sp.]